MTNEQSFVSADHVDLPSLISRSFGNKASAGHQNREAGLAQDHSRHATEHPLPQMRVAIRTHDDEIRAESVSL